MSGVNGAVIVTGAGGAGCGRAIAQRFARDGAPVVVSDVDDAGGQATVQAIENSGGRAAFFRCDVRNESQVRDLVSFAEATFGRVGVLVNNASAPHGDATIASWIDPIETDLLGAIYATRYTVDAMKRGGGGAIVNISSISALWHGRTTPGGFAGYDVAKAGMIRMTTRLAPLGESDAIRVNCLVPGWIATEGVRSFWDALTPEERKARHMPSRLIPIDQLAELVIRLATDPSLAGRVVAWWSEDTPRLIEWGDRGYRHAAEF